MNPTVARLSSLDVYRDGGSLSASFFDPSGTEYTLFFPVALVSRPSGIHCVGYRSPVLDRHTQIERTSPITGITDKSWNTERFPVSWQEAKRLLGEMQPLLKGFDTEYGHVYPEMVKVAEAEGSTP
jgi:hypothetical protein